jgi:hypothetical protein
LKKKTCYNIFFDVNVCFGVVKNGLESHRRNTATTLPRTPSVFIGVGHRGTHRSYDTLFGLSGALKNRGAILSRDNFFDGPEYFFAEALFLLSESIIV